MLETANETTGTVKTAKVRAILTSAVNKPFHQQPAELPHLSPFTNGWDNFHH
jgi:hypothetical protein